nr:MAG TPA: hypothetical protein [Caudoviricetes sp.]
MCRSFFLVIFLRPVENGMEVEVHGPVKIFGIFFILGSSVGFKIDAAIVTSAKQFKLLFRISFQIEIGCVVHPFFYCVGITVGAKTPTEFIVESTAKGFKLMERDIDLRVRKDGDKRIAVEYAGGDRLDKIFFFGKHGYERGPFFEIFKGKRKKPCVTGRALWMERLN